MGTSTSGGTAAAQPFLRWAGSKRQRSHLVRNLWGAGSYRRYIEPFVGSASVFFAVRPEQALLSDLNGDLMDTFRAVRSAPQSVRRALKRLPLGPSEYYEVRAKRLRGTFAAARAARFIYLNRFCFNGLYRTNMDGCFNVPYGRPKTTNLPSGKQLATCSAALRHASLEALDFREALARVRPGDFVYLDPPYAVEARRVFVEYGAAPFSATDLTELARELHTLDRKGVSFLLSYAECREAKLALSPWPRRRLQVMRHVAGFVGARRRHNELYVSNCPGFLTTSLLRTEPEEDTEVP